MKMFKMICAFCVALTSIGLTACMEEAQTGDMDELGELEQPANTGPVGFSDFAELSDTQIAATIEPAFGFGPIQNAAKSLCTDKPVCEVLIFEEGTTLPSAVPFTDRETASAIAFYTLDRDSGADNMTVRCPAIPRTPDENCIGG